MSDGGARSITEESRTGSCKQRREREESQERISSSRWKESERIDARMTLNLQSPMAELQEEENAERGERGALSVWDVSERWEGKQMNERERDETVMVVTWSGEVGFHSQRAQRARQIRPRKISTFLMVSRGRHAWHST